MLELNFGINYQIYPCFSTLGIKSTSSQTTSDDSQKALFSYNLLHTKPKHNRKLVSKVLDVEEDSDDGTDDQFLKSRHTCEHFYIRRGIIYIWELFVCKCNSRWGTCLHIGTWDQTFDYANFVT